MFQMEVFQEQKPQYTNMYKASVRITLVNVPLAKTNHVSKLRVNVGRDYTRMVWPIEATDVRV